VLKCGSQEKIKLTDNAEEIEGKADKIAVVLKTYFLKKI